ncbi:MAG: cell surface protein SprA [Dysgonamonadaceae bacterium]|jgi:cell surface protein SprA|nr:cell surface protein SprA [Dysgonamonadaceae bacterium]
MKIRNKYIIIGLGISLFASGFISSLNADLTGTSGKFPEITLASEQQQSRSTAQSDTSPPRFPVSPVVPETYKEATTKHPVDLRTPENFNNGFEYNPLTDRYEMKSKIGGANITTPISLSREEYINYSFQQSMNSYFKARNEEEFSGEGEKKKDALSAFDFQFDLGPAEKIFGPGGVKLQPRGDVTLKAAINRTVTENPTMMESQRNRTAFDFDMQINASVTASVGDKLNFDMNYNTESVFDFDTKKLKLAYAGKEDEIVKVLEAGNVSMNTTNSLIRGGASLFGIKTELQFGKLTVGAIFSQQESQSRSISSKGNVQTTPFEISADSYDENMHFFIGHYFQATYDEAMSKLPYIKSGVRISELEVWITNKRSNFNQARNIVAFTDLGEHNHIENTAFVHPSSSRDSLPDQQNANDLYSNLIANYSGIRDISRVNQIFEATPMRGGQDYEKVENARKLEPNEYIFNDQLGYISLRTPLQADEVLAVAYAYTCKDKSYQVGELSRNSQETLILKLVKGTSMSPASMNWNLMMKNVYSISNRNIEKDKFRLDIQYKNDSTGIYLNYITEGKIANKRLLEVENLDRLDSRNEPYSDGFFDYVEGYTVNSQWGKIIFPVVEPFGSHLWKKIGVDSIAEKYVYRELYDSTLTIARQTAEKNKFILKGEYKGSGSSDIDLGGYNIARGSVRVTANGVLLKENVDYVMDYTTGKAKIINPAYENAKIDVSSENRSMFGMQRKTMMGLNLNYAFSPKFNLGATIMNLSEMPMTLKTNPGEESINNTLFGFNTNYTTSSYLLTNILDKLPFVNLTAPSQITFTAEYARLIAGHYKSKYGGDHSYIDDFEKAKMISDLRSPYSWMLSATPSMFTESKYSNDVRYGNNRALLAWYYIDGLFTRKSSLTPYHIKNDLNQLSNHYVREIQESELFPNRDQRYNESATIPVLNLAYYPKERGPYNLDADGMNPDGTLSNPQRRWGGIFRKIDSSITDFEANNVEHIEFWLMDPFIYNPNSSGGDLYFNLGEVSEDILKDEKKFFENGLPIDGDTTKVEKTVWGVVPKQQSLVYAFDVTNRKMQDVGLNGLSTDDELKHPTYIEYLNKLRAKLSPDVIEAMERDPLSPLRDPSGDNYHYFRGSDFDAQEASVLERYKHYNGTEGNSADGNDSPESYPTAATVVPDVEDINQDNTLNENEKYFGYRVSIRPKDFVVGENFIVDKRETTPLLKNGKTETVNWYLFKIPINEFSEQREIRDFKTIRFMRMFMTDFADSAILRFATLELVRGDWRVYTKDLFNPALPPVAGSQTSVNLATINIEENGDKQPVNYVMPAGVNRMIDPGQPQLRMENEQSLAMQITRLSSGDARAIYKNTGLDSRQYRRLQMFAHAEKLAGDPTEIQDRELSLFLRLGSDYKNNYYEYEVPLQLTPAGKYSQTSSADMETVWPTSNMFDFPFEYLTNLKLHRNREKRKEGSGVTYFTPYSEYDPVKPMNKMTVVGNPTISDIKVIMIGVRNNSQGAKSVEVWFDELRLTEFNEDGGWAGNANLFVGLSDLGSVNLTGRKETAGFGSLDQGIMERNLDDKQFVSVSAQLEIGKFFPEKAKVSLPVYFSYSEDVVSPKYNPLDQDILLKDALDAVSTQSEKDSIKSFALDKKTQQSLDINNARIGITSKTPMPYDPSNFTFGYSETKSNIQNATTEYEMQTDTRYLFTYSYSPMIKPWQPFNRTKSADSNTSPVSNRNSLPGKNQSSSGGGSKNKFFKEIGIGYLPKNISFTSDIHRNYFELQLRDINTMGEYKIPVSFREDFLWNRDISIQWDLTKNLLLNLATGTEARIDAPHVQVNKKLNYDDYSLWKDSIWKSISSWGTPLHYNQRFSANYSIPFKNIPALNFINAGLSYTANYDWDRGAVVEDEDVEVGNTVRNSRTIGIENASLNLLNLYNKSKFLENVNKKYTLNKSANARNSNVRKTAADQDKKKTDPEKEKRKKKYEGEVQLNMDSATLVRHSLDNKRLRVTARGADGRLYNIEYKKIDNNSIAIKNKDSVKLKLVITQLPPLEDETWYKMAQIAARGLMMVRSVGFSYNRTTGLMLPGFRPSIGDFTGQGGTSSGSAPGWDFAFGLTGIDYIDRANRNDWLIKNTDNNITPAMYEKTETFNFTALLEPFAGMKINLTASRVDSRRDEVYYMYNNPAPRFNGNFNMTTISLRSIFEKADSKNGYYSKSFEDFLKNRQIIASRLENIYSGVRYPSTGFMEGNSSAGQQYNPLNGAVDLNSVDVLVPAFFAAYAGGNANKTSLSFFPALKQLLPNWTASYEGLIQVPVIKKYFKSFVLDHKYRCTYSIGSYNSVLDWVGAGDGIGFIRDVATNNPLPSSPFSIMAVSLMEGFEPLIGLNSLFNNNMTLKMDYKTNRNISLNISSYQIVERISDEFGVDVGYRFENFNKVLKLPKTGGENFNNEFRISAGVSYKKSHDLIRKIAEKLTQATQGNSQTTIKLTGDYNMSRLLVFQVFYDRQVSKPLVSSTAYPLTKSSFGISLKISLSR